MGNAYEIYALRYATMSPRTPHLNYLVPDPHETTGADLDYFVWLIRGGGREILVDTGFNAAEAQLRNRKLTLNPVEALARFGVRADDLKDVVSPICITTTPAISICFRTRDFICRTAR
jgi:hypothetical protein